MTNTQLTVLLAITLCGALLAWPKPPASKTRERIAGVMVYAPILVIVVWSAASAVPAQAEPGPRWPVDTCRTPGWNWGPGDDDCDTVIEPHESGWDCRSMGTHICEPGNTRGVPAGDYRAWDD